MRVSSCFVRSLYMLAVASLAACSSGGGDSPPVAPTVSTSSLSQAEVNVPLNQSLGATGTGPFSWQITNGTLPAGITLQSSGALTGTPNTNQEGQYPFTVRVTGPGGSATKDLKLVIIGSTHRVSVVSSTSTTDPLGGANGPSGDDNRSRDAGISNNGRFVVFNSSATNLVPNVNSGGVYQIYLHDRQTGVTELISVSSSGTPGNQDSHIAAVSDDGSIVAFDSFANNLVPNDTNNARDIFLRNRAAGTTQRISQFVNGNQGTCQAVNPLDCNSFDPAVSADGTVIVFGSLSKLTNDDADDSVADVLVYTRSGAPTLTRISGAVGGGSANGATGSPAVSPDGRYAAFQSGASNLIPGDNVDGVDVFLYDRQTGQLKKVTVVPGGVNNDGDSFAPSVSQNGQFVAFWSTASNLVTGDTNGVADVFVANMSTVPPTIRRIVNLNGFEGNGESRGPSISRDGKIVGFDSAASNLEAGGTGVRDIYVIDRSCSQDFNNAGPCTLKRASIGTDGAASNGESVFPALSGDGKYVAYFSDASNLVPFAGGDGNGLRDTFVTKRQ